jgi:hypothetical protein
LIDKNSNLKVSVLKQWPPKENVPFFFLKHNGTLSEILSKNYDSIKIEDYKSFERYTVFYAVPK